MIEPYCRCPGCGECEGAQEAEKLRKEVVYLRGVIERHLVPEEVEWQDVGFGTTLVCPICRAEVTTCPGPGGPIRHKPSCYWARYPTKD